MERVDPLSYFLKREMIIVEKEEIDYKEFIKRLNLPDDKISLLLYDLYKYDLAEDKKENMDRSMSDNEQHD